MEKIITKQLFRVFTLLALMLTTAQAANATFYVKGSFDNWGAGVAMTDQGNDIFTAEITTTGAIDFKLVNIYDNNGHHEDWWGYSGNYGTATSLPWTFYDLVERGGGDMHINVAGTLRFTLNTYYHWVEVVATTLVWIEGNGTVNNSYTVSDDLQVVYVSTTNDLVFARDLTGTPVGPEVVNNVTPVDYMTTVAKEHRGSYQYNWVMLKFDITAQEFKTLFEGKENYIIQGGSLKGDYKDNKNYTIQVTSTPTLVPCGEGEEYTPNVYCPANFQVDANGCQTGYEVKWVATGNNAPDGTPLYNMEVGETPNAVTYWFMTPKPMEVFELSGALWYDGTAPDQVNYPEGFYMERRWHETANNRDKWYNPAGLKGGIGYFDGNNSAVPTLSPGNSYRFLTVAWKPEQIGKPSYAPLREGETTPLDQLYYPQSGSTRNTTFQAGAVNLDPTDENGQIVTAVNEVKTGSDVVSVTYCDLAGRMSQKPFAGVNIIVTRYSDGTVKTTKAIK